MKQYKKIKFFANKIIVYFYPGKASYWHSITKNRLQSKPKNVTWYYLDFSSKLHYPQTFDDSGIPLYKTPNDNIIYHPIVICQYALGVYEHLVLSKFSNHILKNKFLIQADWLVSNQVKINNGSVWLINYPLPEFGLNKEWFSSMAQGEAISVLTRAYSITKNEKYIRTAEDAILMFDIPVKQGGLLNFFKNLPVFEEYPSEINTVAVLNGTIFALFGLFDLLLLVNSSKAKQLFDTGIESLKQILPYYDTGYWCRYYLFDYPKEYLASYTYMCLVYEQLESLYYITNDDIFIEYSNKWRSYSQNFVYKLRALLNKIFYSNKFFVN